MTIPFILCGIVYTATEDVGPMGHHIFHAYVGLSIFYIFLTFSISSTMQPKTKTFQEQVSEYVERRDQKITRSRQIHEALGLAPSLGTGWPDWDFVYRFGFYEIKLEKTIIDGRSKAIIVLTHADGSPVNDESFEKVLKQLKDDSTL